MESGVCVVGSVFEESEAHIAPWSEEFCTVDGSVCEGSEDFSRWYLNDVGPELPKDFATDSGHSVGESEEVIMIFDGFSEPSSHSHACISSGKGDEVEGCVDMIPEFFAVAVSEPSLMFEGSHSEGNGGEECGGGNFSLPEEGGGMGDVCGL